MEALAVIGPVLSVASTALGVMSSLAEGDNAMESARFRAAQLRQNAGQERAVGQRKAIERRREAELVASRARAVTAGRGGALDPDTVSALGDIDAEGRTNALMELSAANESAQQMELGASAAIREGKIARSQARMKAVGTLVEGAGSFFGKYGSDLFGGPSGGGAPAGGFNVRQSWGYM